MGLIYFLVGFSVPGIFILRPSVLVRKGTFRILAGSSAVTFLLGLMLHFTEPSAGALLAPLPTLIYFRTCLALFQRKIGREPIDVAYNWSPGLFKDRLFSFAFFLGALFILMATALVTAKLSDLGW